MAVTFDWMYTTVGCGFAGNTYPSSEGVGPGLGVFLGGK